MICLLGVVSALLLIQTDRTEAVCGTTPTVWRNDNITCPERAICADVFETIRDWYNGTRCHETRVISNCLCNGNTVCPTSDEAHQLYSSRSHKQFTCRPVCPSLPWCGNISSSRRNGSRQEPTAMTAEQNAAEFDDKTYYRMSCRCPRHHFPVTSRRRARSVKANRYQYNFSQHRYTTIYVCDASQREKQQADPCRSSSNTNS